MAIPSGKYFQTIDGVKTDLADICECEVAGGANGIGLTRISYYTVENKEITYPRIPSNSVCETIDTSFLTSISPYFIQFPKIGTLPIMFDPINDNADYKSKFVYYELLGDSSTVACEINVSSDGIKIKNGSTTTTLTPDKFYKGVVPTNFIVMLQGGGGGGGDGSPQGTDSYTNGGGGGGSGACVWGVLNSSYFTILLDPTAQANKDGASAYLVNGKLYDGDPSIKAAGGKAGTTAATGSIGKGGSGGAKSILTSTSPFLIEWSVNGSAGGDGGASAKGVNGDDMTQTVAPYSKASYYGFQAIYNGGNANRGGGGGASVFSNGGDAPLSGSTPAAPGIGAGGGGGYSKISNQGNASAGGKAYAVIYFGYSKDA